MTWNRQNITRTVLAGSVIAALAAGTAAFASGGSGSGSGKPVVTTSAPDPTATTVTPVTAAPVTAAPVTAAPVTAAPVTVLPDTTSTAAPVAVVAPVVSTTTLPVPVTDTTPTAAPAPAAPVPAAPPTTPPATPAPPVPLVAADCADIVLNTPTVDARKRPVFLIVGATVNCGAAESLFTMRTSDVSRHADPTCSVGTRTYRLWRQASGVGSNWWMVTNPGVCTDDYTLKVDALSRSGAVVASRTVTFRNTAAGTQLLAMGDLVTGA